MGEAIGAKTIDLEWVQASELQNGNSKAAGGVSVWMDSFETGSNVNVWLMFLSRLFSCLAGQECLKSFCSNALRFFFMHAAFYIE